MQDKIFIVGRNRSGTKWLSNLLSNHSEIVSVQREGAGGILETNLFKQYPERFNLLNKEDRTAFEILFKHSNFYKCADIEEGKIDFQRYTDFYLFFNHFMNEYALKNKKKFWLQKASSTALPNLYKYFPNAKIIIIQRKNVVENVISSILLTSDVIKISNIIKDLSSYWMHRKIESRYKNMNNVYFVEYEALKKGTNGVLMDICNELNLDYQENMSIVKFKPNSSFKKYNREDYYISGNKLKINFLSFFISLLPLRMIYLLRWFLRRQNKPWFVSSTFSMYRDKCL